MTAATGQGLGAGPVVATPAPVPQQPSMNERMTNQEQKADTFDGRILTLERTSSNLVAEILYLREQLGLQPLPPDHFA